MLTKSLIVTTLTPGLQYSFRVQSRNLIGLSSQSNTITALTAIVPAAPLGPSSLLFVNSVVIKWSLATLDSQTAYGSEIRGFKVMIRWLDGTYGE